MLAESASPRRTPLAGASNLAVSRVRWLQARTSLAYAQLLQVSLTGRRVRYNKRAGMCEQDCVQRNDASGEFEKVGVGV